MFKIACGHCGKRMSVPDTAVGQVGKCPHCGAQVALMAVPAVATAPREMAKAGAPAKAMTGDGFSLGKLLQKKSVGIAILSVSLTAFLVLILVFAFSSPIATVPEPQAVKPPTPVLKPPQPVAVKPIPEPIPTPAPVPPAIIEKMSLKPVDIAAAAESSVVLIRAVCSSDGKGDAFGSGFILAPGDFIVTNAHVVEGAYKLEVTASDKTTGTITVLVALDKDRDIAVLPTPKEFKGISGLKLAVKQPRMGEAAYAFGSPLGLDNTFTSGIVSQVRPDGIPGVWENVTLIQMDTSISHGSSGGPLLNEFAEVIGVTTRGVNPAVATNLNFALAAAEVASVLKAKHTLQDPIPLIAESAVRAAEAAKQAEEKRRQQLEAERQQAQQLEIDRAATVSLQQEQAKRAQNEMRAKEAAQQAAAQAQKQADLEAKQEALKQKQADLELQQRIADQATKRQAELEKVNQMAATINQEVQAIKQRELELTQWQGSLNTEQAAINADRNVVAAERRRIQIAQVNAPMGYNNPYAGVNAADAGLNQRQMVLNQQVTQYQAAQQNINKDRQRVDQAIKEFEAKYPPPYTGVLNYYKIVEDTRRYTPPADTPVTGPEADAGLTTAQRRERDAMFNVIDQQINGRALDPAFGNAMKRQIQWRMQYSQVGN